MTPPVRSFSRPKIYVTHMTEVYCFLGLGMAVILRNWTLPDKENTDYAVAADEQLEFLLDDVPRTTEGAISQRDSEIQLWYYILKSCLTYVDEALVP